MFGAERYDYLPDMITTAKGLTSGYSPLGAVLCRDFLAEPFLRRRRPRSRTASPSVATRWAARWRCATSQMFEDEDLVGNVARPRGAASTNAWRRCSTCRSSATCAAPATSGRSELVKDQETQARFTRDEAEALLRGFVAPALFEQGLIARCDDRGDPVDPARAAARSRATPSSTTSSTSCAVCLTDAARDGAHRDDHRRRPARDQEGRAPGRDHPRRRARTRAPRRSTSSFESGAGIDSSIRDDDYRAAGATIVDDAPTRCGNAPTSS